MNDERRNNEPSDDKHDDVDGIDRGDDIDAVSDVDDVRELDGIDGIDGVEDIGDVEEIEDVKAMVSSLRRQDHDDLEVCLVAWWLHSVRAGELRPIASIVPAVADLVAPLSIPQVPSWRRVLSSPASLALELAAIATTCVATRWPNARVPRDRRVTSCRAA